LYFSEQIIGLTCLIFCQLP